MRFTDDQRRRRLVARQLDLSRPADGLPAATTPEDVVDRLLALHATDAPSVPLAVLGRVPGLTVADVRAALYERRSVVKVLAMRRTMFVVRRERVPVVHAAASAAVGRRLRARLLAELGRLPTDPPVDDPEAFLARAEAGVHAALAEGPLDGAALAARVPELRTAFLPTTTKTWDVRRAITSTLLSLLSAEGVVVRGEPRGGWASSRHVWAPMEDWLPDGVGDLDEARARVALAEAWLEVFGPATVDDLRWWTGWNLGHTRAALAALDLREVALEAGDGVALARTDLSDAALPPVDDHVALLPTLDPTTMGWTHRDWYLGPHRPLLFDTAGNAGATVWVGGRVVGAWVVRRDGEPAVRLLEDVGSDAAAAVQAEAERLAGLVGSGVVAAYPTPLYRELHG